MRVRCVVLRIAWFTLAATAADRQIHELSRTLLADGQRLYERGEYTQAREKFAAAAIEPRLETAAAEARTRRSAIVSFLDLREVRDLVKTPTEK